MSLRYLLGIIGLALMLVLLLSIGAAHDSQTIDEAAHLAAGYSYIATGDWRLNPEHPPLVKLLAGLFIAPLSPRLPLESAAWQAYDQWNFGKLFLYHNRVPADTLLVVARLPVMIITLVLALVVWRYTTRHFGKRTGLIALCLTVFEPTIIAHGHLVTTDVPLALTFFLSVITFSSYLQSPSRHRLVFATLSFAGAMLTKYSAVLLIPILLSLYLSHRWKNSGQRSAPKFLPILLLFIFVTALSVWLAYGFQVKVPADDPRIAQLYRERESIIADNTVNQQSSFVQQSIRLFDPAAPFGGFVRHFLDTAPIPAYSYWRGLSSVLAHNSSGHGSYILGRTSSYGWWYYFPLAFIFKTPLTFILLFGIAAVIFLKRLLIRNIFGTLRRLPWQWYVVVLPIVWYWFFSIIGHINLGIRHLAPAYPLMIIAAALAANWLWEKQRLGKITVGVLLVFMALSTLSQAPTFITYFNEAAGGPSRGHTLLLDSNLDWGQELRSLATYCERNSIPSPRVAYFGSAEVSYYLPGARSVPTGSLVGREGIPPDVIAISAGILYDVNLDYRWLQKYQPTTIIGQSIYVFDFRHSN